MARPDPWGLERPEAARRAYRLRWPAGFAAAAGPVGGQTAAILDRITGFAWVAQVYFAALAVSLRLQRR